MTSVDSQGEFALGGSPVWSSPVMRSLHPVVEASQFVRTSHAAVRQVASWLAYESFEFPAGPIDAAIGTFKSVEELIDVYFFYGVMNFAFSDFDTGVKFTTNYKGIDYSDSVAMFACAHRSLSDGVPLRDGGFWADMAVEDLSAIFAGNIPIPMPAERLRILNETGEVLVRDYGGAPHRFVRDCAPALYARGDGLLERLVAEFPRFRDISDYHRNQVQFHKLAQLFCWTLYMPLAPLGRFVLTDLEQMTAFADYILPAALQLTGILGYSPTLLSDVMEGRHVESGSVQEVEIRVHTLYAMALLTDAVNQLRPPHLAVIVPQVDLRLWRAYHATHRPHHLTRTIMY